MAKVTLEQAINRVSEKVKSNTVSISDRSKKDLSNVNVGTANAGKTFKVKADGTLEMITLNDLDTYSKTESDANYVPVSRPIAENDKFLGVTNGKVVAVEKPASKAWYVEIVKFDPSDSTTARLAKWKILYDNFLNGGTTLFRESTGQSAEKVIAVEYIPGNNVYVLIKSNIIFGRIQTPTEYLNDFDSADGTYANAEFTLYKPTLTTIT